MSNIQIHVYNISTVITNLQAQTMVNALNSSYMVDFCKNWRILLPIIVFMNTKQIPTSPPPNNWIFIITDIATVSGDLAYHTETSKDCTMGYIFAKTILQDGGVIFYKNFTTPSVSVALSHEILESLCDSTVNGYINDFDGQLWAKEVCDSVQDLVFQVTVNTTNMSEVININKALIQNNVHTNSTSMNIVVGLSDYVLPSFFDVYGKPPYDLINFLKFPFSLSPGGYSYIINTKNNESTIIYGEMANVNKIKKKNESYTRMIKRCKCSK